MFRKAFSILYFIVVLLIAVFALAVGSSNTQMVSFNIQFMTIDLSIAAVAGFSLLFGALFISMVWLYITAKQRLTIALLRKALRDAKRQNEAKIMSEDVPLLPAKASGELALKDQKLD